MGIADEREVLVVDVEDQPGSLGELTRRLAAAHVNVDLAYTTFGGVRVVVATDDLRGCPRRARLSNRSKPQQVSASRSPNPVAVDRFVTSEPLVITFVVNRLPGQRRSRFLNIDGSSRHGPEVGTD